MFKSALLGAAAIAALATAAPAAAADYIVNYTGTSALNGAFTATLRLSVFNGTITAITGTRNGLAVTGLSNYAAATQHFSPTAPYTDFGGFSYDVVGSPSYNVFYDGSLGELNSVDSPNGFVVNESRFTSFAVAAVPEPATWGMMILGFGVIGGAMRRRAARVRTAVAFG